MGSAEKVVRVPGEHTEPWRSLLANNQYAQVTNCVEDAYLRAADSGETEQAALLAAARQLCAACVQIQNEIFFYQRAFQHSEARRDQLAEELQKVLGLVDIAPETAVSQTPLSLWQRLSHFLHRITPESPPVEANPPESFIGTVEVGETAVLSPLDSLPNVPIVEPPRARENSLRPQLTIYCLGQFRVYEDEKPVEVWPSRKGKSILKYLLLHRQQRITKEVLMAEFWPEATADAARNNLNVAIYGLRQALRNGYPEFSHVLFQDDCYFLNPEMEIWVDVEAFEAVYQRACQLERTGGTAVAIQEYHAAEALYQGELLAEDPYEEWPAACRQQLQRQYMQLLSCLSHHYFTAEQYAASITFANKLLRVEPCHEATHRLLMRAYARQRQGYLALRQYHSCVEQLAEELAVPPDPTTTRLYEAIRSHQPI